MESQLKNKKEFVMENIKDDKKKMIIISVLILVMVIGVLVMGGLLFIKR